MITKETVERVVERLNKVLESKDLVRKSTYDSPIRYHWDEVYNAVGMQTTIELSCKLLSCAISDIVRGQGNIEGIIDLENCLRKMANVIGQEIQVRRIEYSVEEAITDDLINGFTNK